MEKKSTTPKTRKQPTFTLLQVIEAVAERSRDSKMSLYGNERRPVPTVCLCKQEMVSYQQPDKDFGKMNDFFGR